MHPSHEPWLVALSLFVAFQGSYVGLHLARQVDAAGGLHRRSLISAAALTQALGIWTMHFVGILAVQLPVTVDFLVLPTLLSFLICVLVVGFAVFAVSTGCASRTRVAIAGVIMGAGIVIMHYLGMYALHASLHMTHATLWVAASVVLSMAASAIALWLGFGPSAKGPVLLPAVLMALAISATHYSAMAGLAFHPLPAVVPLEMPAVSPGLLAVVVSLVAFLVSSLFLLTLIPEVDGSSSPENWRAAAPSVIAPLKPDPPQESSPTSEAATTPQDAPAKVHARTLPVEKDGLQRQFEVAHLVAVQAQAHYTQLFDGAVVWFCPLSISQVEAALDPAVFARVHRSHIVNLDRVLSLKGTADAAVVAMTARIPYRAPVSRARQRWLKLRLKERLAPVE